MASPLQYFLFIFISFSFLIFTSQSQTTSKPNKLILPVQKDSATHLYVTKIQKRTPQLKVPSVVDLNGKFLWVTCEKNYLSSTYHAPRCNSAQCSRANSHYCHTCASTARPGCHNNTCGLMSMNPVTRQTAIGELAQDLLSIQSTKGFNPGSIVQIPQFLFVCAPSLLLQKGLPKNAQGVAGLGHAPISLPTQLASNFGFPPKFALCLPSSTSNGVIFFGDGPYYMLPGTDVSRPASYTPLIISRQGEYYIEVRSIKINGKLVPLNKSLSVDKHSYGGTMISTTTPYTVLEHSIYQVFTKFFANQFSGVPQVKPVAPFGLCYDSKKLTSTRVGPGVPSIDLVLHDQNVKWTIYGANSMVQAKQGVMCLAFVDGGLRTRSASIVIGGHQLQDNLLQFDLAKSRLGFSSSLLFRRTSCASFNFTSTP